jgi:drug/metabolite transporter (DMT)-like permease
MKKVNLKVHLAMLLVAFLYGTNYAAVKIITPSLIAPFGFLIFRVGLAGVLFWIIGIFHSQKVNWSVDGLRIISCAIFGVGINMLFFFKGLSLTSSIHGSIIMTLTPILVAILAAILLKERLAKSRITGLILGLAGASVIILQSGDNTSQFSLLGDVLILLNALSFGTYLVLAKPLLEKYAPITLVKWFFLFGFIFLAPFGYSEVAEISWTSFNLIHWFSFFFVIFAVTIIAYITNIWAMKKVSPSTVGAYIYLQPVFATILGIGFMNESLNFQTIFGAILVFLGVAMAVKKKI